MLFNSYSFLFIFLPLFLAAWQISFDTDKKPPHANIVILLASSLIFYGLWGFTFLGLLLAMIVINYGFGLKLAQPDDDLRTRKIWLVIALGVNLLPLLWFKYSWFIIRNLALLFDARWLFEPPALPLGISFYTFIQIAWLVGIYRRQFIPDTLLRHAVFSSCFMYVISGPIVRYDQVGWQLNRLEGCNVAGLAKGFALFSIGLAKKALLADSIGFYADSVFNAAEKGWPLGIGDGWFGSLAYTFQLYFDFSGYTDMALGLGLMAGLRLPENFNSPYKSTGIVDFWRRWHITLSSWLRDFLYIPLGGNRHGRVKQYRNLFLTMLIGGAWHGAGWTFIIWGALHGVMLAINHFYRATTKDTILANIGTWAPIRLFFILFTFFCLNFCWVVFRAESLDGAIAVYAAMFINSGHANAIISGWRPLTMLGLCFAICWLMPNSHEIINGQPDGSQVWLGWRPTRVWAISLALLTFASIAALSRQSTFLYFQF